MGIFQNQSNLELAQLVGAHRKSVGQQKEQQVEQQVGQPAGHNQETQILDYKNIKETPNVIPKVVDRSPLSNKQKSDLEGLLAYCQDKNLQISERALRRWVRLYESQRIVDHLALLVEGLNGIKKPEAWMKVALKENYSALNSNINENRVFTEDFVKRNKWNGIKITQSYCTYSLSSKDYSFRLPPESFRKMLIQCYEQYCQKGKPSYALVIYSAEMVDKISELVDADFLVALPDNGRGDFNEEIPKEGYRVFFD